MVMEPGSESKCSEHAYADSHGCFSEALTKVGDILSDSPDLAGNYFLGDGS